MGMHAELKRLMTSTEGEGESKTPPQKYTPTETMTSSPAPKRVIPDGPYYMAKDSNSQVLNKTK